MIRYYLTLITLFFTLTIYTQIPLHYYSAAEGKTGYALKTTLYNIIKDHYDIGYSALWSAYTTTDNTINNKVWDMYSDIPDGTPAYTFDHYDNQCGSYSVEGDCYNREHSLPQSWFNEENPMKSDLFHVYPTDGKVNGQRGNYPFGETDNPNWTSSNGSKRGTCSYPGYTGIIFEPIDAYKGDFARSYFYMATRYENIIGNWQKNSTTADDVLDGSFDKVFEDWFLNLMYKWHKNDPVSKKEIDRNNEVYLLQKNRNPFIDHPSYVNLIWQLEDLNEPIINTIFFENFENKEDLGLFTNYNVSGDLVWTNYEYNDNRFAKMTGYDTKNNANEDWMISEKISLNQYTNAKLSFISMCKIYGDDTEFGIYISENYEPKTNPNLSIWTELSSNFILSTDNYEITYSGEYDLQDFIKKEIVIAFKYVTGTSDGKVWQIDDIKITTEIPAKNKLYSYNENKNWKLFPNPAQTRLCVQNYNYQLPTKISIFTIGGKKIFEKTYAPCAKTEINVEMFKKGIYLVKILQKTKKTKTFKLAIN